VTPDGQIDDEQPSVDDVAAEIRVVIGRVRSPSGFDELDLPALDRLAGGDRSAVPALLATAIERVDSEQYREFLAVLLPFPFAPAAPWEQLGPNRRSDGRGERAARAAFGLSWDACNRAGQLLDGRSRRDWAERFLADAVLEPATGAPVSAPVGPEVLPTAHAADPTAAVAPAATAATHATDTDTAATGHRRAIVAAATSLVLLLTFVGAVLVLRPTGDDEEPRPEVADRTTVQGLRVSCDLVGVLNDATAELPNSTSLSARLVELHGTLPVDDGCPSRAAFKWDELVVQELIEEAEPDLPGAMLVERSTGLATYMTPTAYARYRTIGSGDGLIAQELAGMPAPVTTFPDGHQEVMLSKGVLLVAEQEGAPFFWLPADFVELWRSSPELGLPTGNPLPKLVQDFQFGYAQLYEKESVPRKIVVPDPTAEPPDLGTLTNTVVRQEDNTSWWIGSDGRRYWVPTGGVYDCLVDVPDDEVPAVRGYQMATLRYAGHAECPD